MLAALFLWQLGHQVLPNVWSFYTILKFHWSSDQVGYSLTWVGLVMAVAQGVFTGRLVPWFGGERPAALAGMAAAVLAYLGYALVPQGWMMYPVSLLTFVFALAYPSMNALASQRAPANSQGELQGAVAMLYSLSSIAGPPLMTGVFGHFSHRDAALYFPGAPFVLAALLTVACAALFVRALRLPGAVQPAPAMPSS
jgi:DHA1 family tetracycline resistance protein-like MFS transporter